LSESDKDILRWFLQTYQQDIVRLLPGAIGQKEQLAIIAAGLSTYTPKTADPDFRPLAKTATDVLRIAVALSNGDVSLATKTKFIAFGRGLRRGLLGALENVSSDLEEDMMRFRGRWLRLGERLHPGEFSDRFPKAFRAFRILRENIPIVTFSSQVEEKLKGRTPDALQLLASRPGELTRRLDHLLRTQPSQTETILETFAKAAEKTATPVLLQARAHFAHRGEGLRSALPKGAVAKLKVIQPAPPEIPHEVRQSVVSKIDGVLRARFAKLPPLGKVYVDPALRRYPVPFSQRSASKALHTVSRGSRIELCVENTVRFFVWWKNGSDRVDIDLSAAILNSDWTLNTTIAYYNLKDFGGHHSGDITNAPNGASEFIDIDLDQVRAREGRYIAMTVSSFTCQPYKDLPECFAGWMARNHPASGEIYEPKTVRNKFDITADTKFVVPLIIDVEKREVLWCDIALKSWPKFPNCVELNKYSLSLICRALAEMQKTSLETLFHLHAGARGELTASACEADTVFAEFEGITPTDIDKILSEYL